MTLSPKEGARRVLGEADEQLGKEIKSKEMAEEYVAKQLDNLENPAFRVRRMPLPQIDRTSILTLSQVCSWLRIWSGQSLRGVT